jgi:murein L,D-transpeptidase YafK
VLKNIIYFTGSLLVFFAGIIIYGLILNSREVDLQEILRKKSITGLENVHLIISRSSFSIDLYSDSLLIKSYKAAFGKNRKGVKIKLNDNITPVGKFIVCRKDSSHKYHKFLKLDFPNEDYLAAKFKNGYISENDYYDMLENLKKGSCDDFLTADEIGIHGIGEYDFIFRNLPFVFNWTNGSVAVSNRDIEELFSITLVGTEVFIRE